MLLVLTIALLVAVVAWRVDHRLCASREEKLRKRLASLSGMQEDSSPWYHVEAIAKRLEQLSKELDLERIKRQNDLEIINSVVDGMITVGEDGEILFANRRAKELLDVSGREEKLEELHESFPILDAVKSAFESEKTIQGEFTFHRKRRHLQFSVTPVILPDGKRQAVIVLHDVSNEREAERMLREFVADVTHELRTPLTSIHGYAETLLDGGLEDKEAAVKFLKTIEEESARMSRLINDLLDLQKLESGKVKLSMERFPLNEAVEHVLYIVKPIAESLGVTLETDLEEGVEIVGDYDRIVQMILNLVDNAVKYTSVKESGEKLVSVRLYGSENGGAVLEIEDTGIGIPESSITRLFRRFYRVDKHRARSLGGAGLGLAITKEIAEKHGAMIDVRSEVGVGTLFRISFPPVGGAENESSRADSEEA
ncbi:MAG: PAS domain-containing protein [Thermotogae bacterium]|nr:PAS domain-containing protein [Thermotogota bacterium]